jgi:gliding motility-associated-like protein
MRLLLTLTLILSFFFLDAQTPAVEWQKCLGSNFSDYADNIQPTSDGGYIISGLSTGPDNGDVMGHHGNPTVGDLWIVKMNSSGQIEWQKSLGGNQSETGGYILQTSDGGYIIAGASSSVGCELSGNHGEFDFWVVKLNSKGDMQWQKMYGGSKTEIAYSISQSADGGYFVAGITSSNDGDVSGNHGDIDYWIIKIDAVGKLIWQKTLGGTQQDICKSIRASSDGGCIVTGTSDSNNGDASGNHGSTDGWVVKLSDKGTIQWQKMLGGSMSEQLDCIQITSGGYILSGLSNSFDGDVNGVHGGYDAWIVKLDLNGKIIWQKCYGGSNYDVAKYIQNTADGGYIFIGASISTDGDITCNAGTRDLLVIKINSAGILQWQKTIGGVDFDEGVCVQPLQNGSYIVAGNTSSSDIESYHTPVGGGIYDDKYDYWVIKLSPPPASGSIPVVKIDPSSVIICQGNKAKITASVLYGGINPVYQWQKNGITVGNTSSVYIDQALNDNDQVTCIVKQGNKCENSNLQGSDVARIKLQHNLPLPEISISSENPYACNCATVTIKAAVSNGGGSSSFQWKINGNNIGGNTNILISNNLKDGDIITCTYSDNFTCAADGSVIADTIIIGGANGALPTLSISASADTVCKGTAVTFTAIANHAGTNPVYQWKINNVNAGTNSAIFLNAGLSDGDIVTCSIKTDPLFTCAAGAGANSNGITIRIIDKLTPSVKIAANTTSICAGSPVTFTATASGAGSNPVYQWKVNGVNTGTNNKTFSSSSLANNDTISCIVNTDPSYTCALATQAVSDNIVLTVTSGTVPTVAITADRNDVCAGENVTITARAENAGINPTFQWVLNNEILPDNSPVYKSNRLVNGDRIFCRVIPGAGACSALPDSSDIFLASIKNLPVVTVTPADTTIMKGMQASLNAEVSGSVSAFQWTPAGKLTNPLSLDPQTIMLNENTSYTLTVIDDNGCSASATARIKIGIAFFMPDAFTPNDDGLNDLFRIPPDVILDLKEFSIYDRWGTKIFTTTNKNTGWDGTINGKKQGSGSYVYFLKCRIYNKDIFHKGRFTLIK